MLSLPGTSNVSVSFRTPKLHFGAFERACSSSSSDSLPADFSPGARFDKNGRRDDQDRLLPCGGEAMMAGACV